MLEDEEELSMASTGTLVQDVVVVVVLADEGALLTFSELHSAWLLLSTGAEEVDTTVLEDELEEEGLSVTVIGMLVHVVVVVVVLGDEGDPLLLSLLLLFSIAEAQFSSALPE